MENRIAEYQARLEVVEDILSFERNPQIRRDYLLERSQLKSALRTAGSES